jgi:glycosyltransferase involved in cell wall biosynthesis
VSAALPSLIPDAKTPSASKLRRLAKREAVVWTRADGYIAITRGIVDHMTSLHGTRPSVAVVPDGMRLGPDPAPLPAAPVVGYAGHLYAWKGVDVLLRAVASIPPAQALIVGGHEREPDLGRLQALTQELGIADRVRFTGLVEPARVPPLLAEAYVLVLPNPASAISTHFTSPLKMFEYMAAGRPIVASDLPSIREVLRDGDNALLVAPGDPHALAAAVTRLIEDRDLAQRLARTARADAGGFTWERRAERLDALFSQVASG